MSEVLFNTLVKKSLHDQVSKCTPPVLWWTVDPEQAREKANMQKSFVNNYNEACIRNKHSVWFGKALALFI